jgi:hypothetical protein
MSDLGDTYRVRSFFVTGFVAGLEHAVDNDGWEGAAKDVAYEAWDRMFGDAHRTHGERAKPELEAP